ncbi:MAG: chloride channel protein, partial [Octadecabacter sp.]
MAEPQKSFIRLGIEDALGSCRDGWTVVRTRGPSQVQFWFIALLVGIAASFAAIGFRYGIETFQAWLYRTDDIAHLRTHISGLDWWWVLLIPMAGGLVVGVILHRFTDDGRVRSVADVIEGAALYDGRVEGRKGLASALSSFITLSTG